jgi:hypothetical protein
VVQIAPTTDLEAWTSSEGNVPKNIGNSLMVLVKILLKP